MFEIGDSVIDRDADDPDVMRILDLNVGEARNVEIEELGKSVYEVNPKYPANDSVVKTVYETWLDSYVPSWEDWPKNELNNRLYEYSRKWDVPLNSYYYPKSRLVRANRWSNQSK